MDFCQTWYVPCYCGDLVGIANGQILSMFDGVICLRHASILCFWTITWVNFDGFSPNLVYALILWRSGLGLLMGKFHEFFDGVICPRCTRIFVSGQLRWLSWMHRPTGDQEVAGSTPAEVGNILSWRLIMKYFLWSFSPFRWFKKGSCQFLAKECAQYWLTAQRTKPAQLTCG